MSAAPVPRTATFDDLRVGQWVAWCDPGAKQPQSGVVEAVFDEGFRFKGQGIANDWTIHGNDVEAGTVTILRDAPAPPVTVRREDYDALVASLDRALVADTALGRAARALIDNADTGSAAYGYDDRDPRDGREWGLYQ